eukprot:1396628-Amphidinium_carterae.1
MREVVLHLPLANWCQLAAHGNLVGSAAHAVGTSQQTSLYLAQGVCSTRDGPSASHHKSSSGVAFVTRLLFTVDELAKPDKGVGSAPARSVSQWAK